ncbi:MAG: ABC transporter ATP-binding protein [Lachnospiraceae bacterium]|nr:ABC transporter ATP-binding protein [Lachnospiraceae bacterium]
MSTKSKQDIAIQVSHVDKIYKLYDKPMDRLKEALGLTRKKRYVEHYALHDVDITIHQGECLGIIGTNGSGKSTILKIITGVLNPTKGDITVNGRISALLELGAGFNMEYTGIENIYLNGTMIGFSREEITAKMDDILEFADIGDFVHQPVKTYSSGMFVRLAFAVAINIDPEILIVDEALSVGDVFFQAKCYHKFEEFKKMGKTILFVSHDLSSISKYCDKVVLLNQGKKLGEGTPKEMIDAYKRVLVGQYIVEDNKEEAENTGKRLLDDPDLVEAANKKKKKVQTEGVNPDMLEYGEKEAEVTEFYITDNKGVRATAVMKNEEFAIHMKVKFHQDIAAPIFAFSFKNIRGTEITGTNTMFEKAYLEASKVGEQKEIIFTQKMTLQGGEYLLSFGVTGYEGSDFKVYHRLYDAMNVTVISDKNTVGFYDMCSMVTVKDIS